MIDYNKKCYECRKWQHDVMIELTYGENMGLCYEDNEPKNKYCDCYRFFEEKRE